MGAHILCVEDEPSLRTDFAEELRDAGYTVSEAADGLEAREFLRRERPDLVLCDITMPGLNGRQLLRELRESDSPAADVPFIFLTAHGQKSDLLHGRELGADDYLVKPVDFDVLLSVVQSRLQSVQRAQGALRNALEIARSQLDRLAPRSWVAQLGSRAQLAERLAAPAGEQALVLARLIESDSGAHDASQRERGAVIAALQAAGTGTPEVAARSADTEPETGTETARIYQVAPDTVATLLPAQAPRPLAERLHELERALAAPPAGGRSHTIAMVATVAAGRDARPLLDDTMVAMHLAQLDGLGGLVELDAPAAQRLRRLREVEAALPDAIDSAAFELDLQPQIDARDGRVIGLEALLRWRTPRLGAVSPDLFIPLAERLGLSGALTQGVIRLALAAARRLRDHGHGIPIAINVSARDLGPELPGLITAGLDAAGLPASALEVEITETSAIHQIELARSAIDQLRASGVGVSLDDFGTGFASIAYLRSLHFDRLKIDKLFVQDIDVNPVDRDIVASIVRMTRMLHLDVLVEGVETPAQLQVLQELGCHWIQGFVFSAGMPMDALLPWLAARAATAAAAP